MSDGVRMMMIAETQKAWREGGRGCNKWSERCCGQWPSKARITQGPRIKVKWLIAHPASEGGGRYSPDRWLNDVTVLTVLYIVFALTSESSSEDYVLRILVFCQQCSDIVFRMLPRYKTVPNEKAGRRSPSAAAAIERKAYIYHSNPHDSSKSMLPSSTGSMLPLQVR